MRLPAFLRPTLLREIGSVYIALSALGFANFSAVLYLLSSRPGAELQADALRWVRDGAAALAAVNLVVLAWGLWATSRRVVRPILRLREAVMGLRARDFSARAQEQGLFDELRDVAEAFNGMSSELKDALSRLENERNFSAALLERLPVGVAVINAKEQLIFANPFFGRLVAEGNGKPLGLAIAELLPVPELARRVREALEERRGAEGLRFEFAPGWAAPRRHLRAAVLPVWPSPLAPERALVLVEDETKEFLAAQQRKEWQDMLIHDVKSPLTAVIAALKILPEESSDPKVLGLVQLADRGAGKILEMLETYLQLLRLESGAVEIHTARVPVGNVVVEVLAGARLAADQKGVGLSSEVEPELFIDAAPELFRRLLANLVDNAVKFSRDGDDAGIRARREGQAIQIEVWDRGPGIPPEDLPHVFDRFYRSKRAQRAAGTGLGLAFCKLTAELHGWEIAIRPEPGGGTVVSIVGRSASAN